MEICRNNTLRKIDWDNEVRGMCVLYDELKSHGKLKSKGEEEIYFGLCRTILMLLHKYERNELFGYDPKELEEFLFKRYK